MLDVCWAVGASPLYTAHCTPLYTVHQLLGTRPHPPLATLEMSPGNGLVHIQYFYELSYPVSSQQV